MNPKQISVLDQLKINPAAFLFLSEENLSQLIDTDPEDVSIYLELPNIERWMETYKRELQCRRMLNSINKK